MLSVRVIPCLDCKDGRVVKGVRFADLRDCGDPAEAARRYAAQGADELVLLDVAATLAARRHRLATVAAVRAVLDVPLCVGGGVASVADGKALLEAGADKVAVNSAATLRPALLTELADAFGRQCVVLAIDAVRGPTPDGAHGSDAAKRIDGAAPRDLADRRAPATFAVRSHAATAATELDAASWAAQGERLGAGEILLTAIHRDGTGLGYDEDLLAAVRAATALPLIASGGARTADHLAAAIAAGADAVLVASMLHDGRTTVPELKNALRARGLRCREETPC